jgi:hypothetical protein
MREKPVVFPPAAANASCKKPHMPQVNTKLAKLIGEPVMVMYIPLLDAMCKG